MSTQTKKQDNQDIKELSFEEALTKLEEIIRELETGKAPLEKSINYYERGVALKEHCESKLKQAQKRIEKISLEDSGEITSQAAEDLT